MVLIQSRCTSPAPLHRYAPAATYQLGVQEGAQGLGGLVPVWWRPADPVMYPKPRIFLMPWISGHLLSEPAPTYPPNFPKMITWARYDDPWIEGPSGYLGRLATASLRDHARRS